MHMSKELYKKIRVNTNFVLIKDKVVTQNISLQ